MPSVKNMNKSPGSSGISTSSSNSPNRSPIVDLQAHDHAVGREQPGSRFEPALPAGAASGVCPARAKVIVRASRSSDRVGHRDEASVVEIAGDDAIGRNQQIAGRAMDLAERQHQSFQLGHVERRRRAFARHVGDQEAEPVALERQEVVVVAADFPRRGAVRRHRDARHLHLALRQQRHLDVPRDAQLLLQALLLGHLGQQLASAGPSSR